MESELGVRRMLYFTYGSNLDPTQMRLRCPQARYVNKARLDGYRLCFPRWSKIRASAVVGLEPAAGETVWGVLYEIGDGDLARLDEREGYDKRRAVAANSHNRATVAVTLPDGKVREAETYVATPSPDAGLPSAEYIDYLMQLAVACDLPESYRDKLKTVETAPLAA
jgi:gamma-glutamylcyclotransferase (GGCT)/AIG2-like uncharacterized protein YtfP